MLRSVLVKDNDQNQETINPIVIPISIFELFLEEDNASDLLALYSFYYYKALKRNTDTIKTTVDEVQIKLNWSLIRTRKTKNKLKAFNLIKMITLRDENRFIGNFIKVNYLKLEQTSSCLSSPSDGNKYIKGGNPLQLFPPKEEEKNIIPPTLAMVTKYCKERKNNINAQSFIDHYEARGWKLKGYTTKMKDWQAAIRTWEGNETPRNTSAPYKAKFIREDGIKYTLGSDGRYRSEAGEIYVP